MITFTSIGLFISASPTDVYRLNNCVSLQLFVVSRLLDTRLFAIGPRSAINC